MLNKHDLSVPEVVEVCLEVNESGYEERRELNFLEYLNQLGMCRLIFWRVNCISLTIVAHLHLYFTVYQLGVEFPQFMLSKGLHPL